MAWLVSPSHQHKCSTKKSCWAFVSCCCASYGFSAEDILQSFEDNGLERRGYEIMYDHVQHQIPAQEQHQKRTPCFWLSRSRAANIGNPEAEEDQQDDVALQCSQLNWLMRSHVADNPLVIKGVVAEVRFLDVGFLMWHGSAHRCTGSCAPMWRTIHW